jgi:tRNA A-37 threonylcarbamoyl transferase component Bud32
LEALPQRSLHQARNWSKASVYEVEWPRGSGRAVVVKDMRATPLWFRVVAGRGFLRRESRVLRLLRDVEGVPALVSWIDADALAMEKANGRPLSTLQAGDFEPQVLENVLGRIGALLAHVHALGVVHGDLHAHNVLVDEAGRVSLIDWATASVFGRGARGAKKWSFEEWRALDRRALAKMKVLHAPELISPLERDLLVHGGSRIYRTVKAFRRRFDQWRGKKSGAQASALERYIAEQSQRAER